MNTSAQPILELRHASVMRGRACVLHDLTLTIDRGEHVAFGGPVRVTCDDGYYYVRPAPPAPP